MPWNTTTKKMVGSANINTNGDIQLATQQSYPDVGACIKFGCQQGRVNKWSRIKPIHYPGKFRLSLEDFRGTAQMIAAGIVYGLAVPGNYSNPDPAAIHATSWDYVGYPNGPDMESQYGGQSPYRFFDFEHPDTTPSQQTRVGYSGNARADLGGKIPSTSKFWIGGSQSESAGDSVVNAEYSPNNTEGVRIAEFIVRTSSDEVIDENTLKARLANCYPGILIGNYVTALTHGSTNTALPLWHNNAWTSDNWYVDMSKVLGKTVPGGGQAGKAPWTSATSATASLVLIYPQTSGSTLIAAGDAGTDVAAYWVYLSSDLAWNASFFPIPGATGVAVELSKHTTSTIANVTAITKTSSGFNVTYAFSANYNGAVSVLITASVSQSGGTSATVTRTISFTSVTGGTSHTASYGWSADFDLFPMPGDTYNVTVSIHTTIGGRQTAGEGMTTEITI